MFSISYVFWWYFRALLRLGTVGVEFASRADTARIRVCWVVLILDKIIIN